MTCIFFFIEINVNGKVFFSILFHCLPLGIPHTTVVPPNSIKTGSQHHIPLHTGMSISNSDTELHQLVHSPNDNPFSCYQGASMNGCLDVGNGISDGTISAASSVPPLDKDFPLVDTEVETLSFRNDLTWIY